MKFLLWQIEQEAIDSLVAVNGSCGCPIAQNFYRMDEWDFVTQSDSNPEWGFFSPDAAHMGALTGIFSELQSRPAGWDLNEPA